MRLVMGTLSTWSLRAWICSQLAGVKLDLIWIDLGKSGYKTEVLKYSPTGLVPALLDNDLVVHDSLAIVEYLNEFSGGALYPVDSSQRAIARSLCMEMHAGFMDLRSQCSFSLDAVAPLVDINGSIQVEISRVEAIFSQAKLPFMFEQAGAVDAFYAILAYRLEAYGVVFPGKAGEYQHSLLSWFVLQQAIQLANTLK